MTNTAITVGGMPSLSRVSSTCHSRERLFISLKNGTTLKHVLSAKRSNKFLAVHMAKPKRTYNSYPDTGASDFAVAETRGGPKRDPLRCHRYSTDTPLPESRVPDTCPPAPETALSRKEAVRLRRGKIALCKRPVLERQQREKGW